MNKNLIRSFVLRNEYYYFKIGEYFIPKYIYTIEDNKKLDIESIVSDRNNIINESGPERTFKYDVSILQGKAKLRKPLYNYFKEFPIFIENRELWNNLLDFYNFSKEDRLRNTNYFLLDFFFYESDFIVEIDSELHNVNYDKARDNYIKTTYGLDTIRFFDYGKDEIDRVTYLGLFKEKIKTSYNRRIKLGIINRPSLIDYSETIINNYIRENKQSLLLIDSISRFFGIKFIVENNLVLNYSDLHKISPKLFKRDKKYNESDIETLILNNSIKLLYDVYGKRLKITPQNP